LLKMKCYTLIERKIMLRITPKRLEKPFRLG
jgi:hypothetical protein